MKKETFIFSVPCDLKFTETVEGFIKIVLPFLNVPDPENMVIEFQMVLNEAFVNTVKHSSHDPERLVDVTFEYDSTQLITRIKDSGKGWPVHEFYPPYPKNLIGTEQIVSKTIDGQLVGKVKDSRTFLLQFQENDLESLTHAELIENLRPNGMGLAMIAKIMDEVKLKFDEKSGNQLEMVKFL